MKILRGILLSTIIVVSAQAYASEDFESLAKRDLLSPLCVGMNTQEMPQDPLENLFENYTTENFDKMVVYAHESLKAEHHWKKFYELLPTIRAIDEDGFFALRQIFAIPFLNYLGRISDLDKSLSSVFHENSFDPSLNLLKTQSEIFKKMKLKWDALKKEPQYDEKRQFIDIILTDFSQSSTLQKNSVPISLRDIHISSLTGEKIKETLELLEGFINNEDTPLWLLKETNRRIQFLKKEYRIKFDPLLAHQLSTRISINPQTTISEIIRLWEDLKETILPHLQYDFLMNVWNRSDEASHDFYTIRFIAQTLSSLGSEYNDQANEFWRKVLNHPQASIYNVDQAAQKLQIPHEEFYGAIMNFWNRSDATTHDFYKIKFIAEKLSSLGDDYLFQANEFWERVLNHPQASLYDIKEAIRSLIKGPDLENSALHSIIQKIFSFPNLNINDKTEFAKALQTIRRNKTRGDLQTKCLAIIEVQAWLGVLDDEQVNFSQKQKVLNALKEIGEGFQDAKAQAYVSICQDTSASFNDKYHAAQAITLFGEKYQGFSLSAWKTVALDERSTLPSLISAALYLNTSQSREFQDLVAKTWIRIFNHGHSKLRDKNMAISFLSSVPGYEQKVIDMETAVERKTTDRANHFGSIIQQVIDSGRNDAQFRYINGDVRVNYLPLFFAGGIILTATATGWVDVTPTVWVGVHNILNVHGRITLVCDLSYTLLTTCSPITLSHKVYLSNELPDYEDSALAKGFVNFLRRRNM